MKLLVPFLSVFFFSQSFGQPLFQLAPPMLKYQSAFFKDNTSFEVVFNQPGAQVHYTLNGNDPTENDAVYASVVPVTKKTVVKVKAFGKDFLPSETVRATFISDGKAIKQIRFSKPNESYANAKATILNDNVGGIANYRSGTWLGYDNDTVTITVDLVKKEKINSVLINLLQDQNNWIFMPEALFVYYFDDGRKKYVSVGKEIFSNEQSGDKECNVQEIIPSSSVNAQKLKLVLVPIKKIPDWHNGKGNHGWLFIDEIKVY
jgi:hypothetical protein